MHANRNPGPADDAGQGRHVVLVGMHAARRQKPHQVARAAACLQPLDQVLEHRAAGQRTVGDGGVDARQVLRHDAARAQAHVADLGVAHLPGGQTHVLGRGNQARHRILARESVPGGRFSQGDGIFIGIRPVAPAVEDAENDRTGPRLIASGIGHGLNIC